MQDETIEILRTLVSFDTSSSRSNRTLIDWVAERLARQGVEVEVLPGDEPGKVNLFASLGPTDVPGIVLAGHVDVAPVQVDTWQTDPYRLISHDGRVYGRGTTDAKGWIACCLAAVPFFQQVGLKKPVHIALSYNGETNMRGMERLAAHLQSLPVLPAAAVVGGPTSMRVVTADKGTAIWRVKIKGKEAHSSRRHEGVSAVETAARIIAFVLELQERQKAVRNDAFEFPHTSVHVGSISGGNAANIVSAFCEFPIEIRALPGEDADALFEEIRGFCASLQAGMQAVDPACGIEFEPLRNVPGLTGQGNESLTAAVGALLDDHRAYHTGMGCEGGILQAIGIPTVNLGPGEMDASHLADESLSVEQIEQCEFFLKRLARHLAADASLDSMPSQQIASLYH